MKFLIFLALASATLNSTPPIEDRHGPDPLQSSRLNYYGVETYNHPPDISAANRRDYRAAGGVNLNVLLDKLTMVARVANGISLQQELSTPGAITTDKLISELLRFGAATPSQIIAINKTKIETTMKTLKELPTGLVATPNVTAVEKSLKTIEGMLMDTEGLGNLTMERKEKEDFEELIGNLAKNGGDIKNAADLKGEKLYWDAAVAKLTEPTPRDAATSFNDVKKSLKTLMKSNPSDQEAEFYFGQLIKMLTKIKSLAPIPTTAWTSKKFNTSLKSLDPTLKAFEELKKYETPMTQLSQTPPDQWTAYSTFMTNILSKIATLNRTHFDIGVVKTLLTAHEDVNTRNRILEHTAGFPGGTTDVSMMFVDLNDAWMKEVVGTDRLSAALERLRDLDVLAKKVMDALRGNRFVEDVTPLYTLIDSFNKLMEGSNETLKGITSAQSCILPPPVNSSVVADIEQLLESIDAEFEIIKVEHISELKTALNTDGLVEMCDEVLVFCEESARGEYQKAIANFKNYSRLEELQEAMGGIFNATDKISASQEIIKSNATEVQSMLTDLETFNDEVQGIATYVDCQKSNKYLKALMKAVKIIEDIRDLNQSILMSQIEIGTEVVMKVVDTSDELKRLKTAIDVMREVSNPESDLLRNLTNASSHSKTIGWAVQGISNMRNALEKKSEVQKILSTLDVIAIYRDNLTDPDDEESRRELKTIDTSIRVMFLSLDTFRFTLSIPTGSKLGDHYEIFEKAQAVSGVAGDFRRMIHLVGKMKALASKPEDKQKVEELELEIRLLESMGIDFASYHKSFAAARDSLEALDEFFEEFVQGLMPVLTVTEAEVKKTEWLFYVISTIAAISLVVLIGFIVSWRTGVLCFRKTKDGIVCDVILDPVNNRPVLSIDLLIFSVGTQVLGTPAQKYEIWENLLNFVKSMEVSEDRAHPYVRLSPQKYKNLDIRLNPYSSVPSVKYHANMMVSRTGKRFIAAQSPLIANAFHDDTTIDFIKMILAENVDSVVMIGALNTCSRYYSATVGHLKLGRYTIYSQTVSFFMSCTDVVEISIRIVDRKTKLERTIRHYQIEGWEHGDVPRAEASIINGLLSEICSTNDATLIHCSTGTGCSMTLVGIEVIRSRMEADADLSFSDAFKCFAGKRFDGFEKARQIGYLQVMVVYRMTHLHGLEDHMFRQLHAMFQDMIQRQVGVPKGKVF